MNRYRNAPGLRGPTKATPSTLCQKCLKRGHYSYECKVTAQERPYTSRPSRTQQLLNPKLRPQLSADVPSDSSRTKGLATEILAKREEERVALRPLNELGQHHHIRSARYQRYRPVDHTQDRPLAMRTMVHERAMVEQGPSRPMFLDKGRDATAMRLLMIPQDSRSRSREWQGDRNTRRRRRESSPEERGRPRHLSRDRERRDRSRSQSVDHSRIARTRRSATPEKRPERGYPASRNYGDGPSHSQKDGRGQGRAPPPPRERSLSPYSKRLALTQSMNMGN
ncbi:hypothetical protein BO79DRAFT_186350 [Aspergillus costaricaensis CBS 115574]|uniref:zinc finger CCHC-type containing 10 n=1 Tax=Aspergillus costaricaensis CBS 115574 TaxID=1448317 RepID=UPI000DBD3114|nr:hypothetical protein BO79DRAFT_186350 [Aspergillus costaricaensis CBS 115574]RAK93664.1 hypothetical protein BO79DRAFT_186350 [Aspergillus costaricaensis CBS 115574]